VNRSGREGPGIEFELAECALIAAYVLLQNGHECFGLLRAEVHALEVLDLDLGLALLLHGSEDQEEIPNVDSDLHAIGVVLAILGGIDEFDVRLDWDRHRLLSLAALA